MKKIWNYIKERFFGVTDWSKITDMRVVYETHTNGKQFIMYAIMRSDSDQVYMGVGNDLKTACQRAFDCMQRDLK